MVGYWTLGRLIWSVAVDEVFTGDPGLVLSIHIAKPPIRKPIVAIPRIRYRFFLLVWFS